MTATEIDATIYALYPRKVGRVAALKAIAKAVKVVQKEHGCDALEARRVLYKAVHAYARSPAGRNPDRTLIPHPATWFNRGSYFDDPHEWQLGGQHGATKAVQTTNNNRAALLGLVARRRAESGTGSGSADRPGADDGQGPVGRSGRLRSGDGGDDEGAGDSGVLFGG